MLEFTVIDTTTNQYPDLWKIATTEEWAKHLMYCDMEGFAISEDGELLLLDECGGVAYCPADRFKVVYTADVAPRAEVANRICCEIEEEIVAALESNYRALKEWDDGRCNDYILEMVNRIKGKIDALRGIEAFVEELKKKYEEKEGTTDEK